MEFNYRKINFGNQDIFNGLRIAYFNFYCKITQEAHFQCMGFVRYIYPSGFKQGQAKHERRHNRNYRKNILPRTTVDTFT